MDELQKERERMEIIKTKINYSREELNDMSDDMFIKCVLRMKQDETMKWQRLCSQLIYYVTVVSLILGAVVAFGFLVSKG